MKEVGRLFFPMIAALLLLSLGGCGTAPGVQGRSVSSESFAVSSRLTSGQADDITIYALGLVGTPYRFGGNTPDSGFDCSGLIGHVYQTRASLAPPRTVSRMKDWGYPVTKGGPRTGDLVLFAQSNVVTHAGIYVGNDRFVHAPSTGGEVRLDSLNSKYWSGQQVAFRRP